MSARDVNARAEDGDATHERAPHEHEHGEEFPRGTTVAIVGEALAGERRRAHVHAVLVATGITLVLLGVPTESLQPGVVAAVESTSRVDWNPTHLAAALLAEELRDLGLSAERAWFLLSALAGGVTSWLLLTLARARGASTWRALACLALVVCAPLVWLAFTTPTASGLGLMGACACFVALSHLHERPTSRVARVVAACVWLAAASLHMGNVAVWPALVIAGGRRMWIAAPTVLAVWLFFAITALFSNHDGFWDVAVRELESRSPLAVNLGGSPLSLAASWFVALGGLALGVVAWCAQRIRARGTVETLAGPIDVDVGRDPTRRQRIARAVRPHLATRAAWLPLFVMVPWLWWGLGSDVFWSVPHGWSVPLAYLLVLRVRSARVVVTATLVVGAAFAWSVFRGPRAWIADGDEEWRALIERTLNADDLVLTDDDAHAYLLGERYGIEVVRPAELETPAGEQRWRAALRAGRGLVLDRRRAGDEEAGAPFQPPDALRYDEQGREHARALDPVPTR